MAFVAHAKKEREEKHCMGLSSLNSTALKFIQLGLQQNGYKTRMESRDEQAKSSKQTFSSSVP